MANVGPIIFFAVSYRLANSSSVSKLTLDKAASLAIMAVGLTSTLLLAFLWQRTVSVAGVRRSVALLALSFGLALMDCTSSLAYVAFLAALKPVYMASFFLGEGLSGLLPALMALAQGAGDILCLNGTSTGERNVTWGSGGGGDLLGLNGTSAGEGNVTWGSGSGGDLLGLNGTSAGEGNVTGGSGSGGDLFGLNGTSAGEGNFTWGGGARLENVTTYHVYPSYQPPRFSVKVFFLLLSAMIAASIAAFALLNCWGYCKDEFVAASSYTVQHEGAEWEGGRRGRRKGKGSGLKCGGVGGGGEGAVEEEEEEEGGGGVSNPALDDDPSLVSSSCNYSPTGRSKWV